MKFDRSPGHSPNAERSEGCHLDNVYVGADLLRARGAEGGKWARFGSVNSEDAVTWNVLMGLWGQSDVDVPGAIDGLPGGKLLLKDGAMLLWNVPVRHDLEHTRLRDALTTTQKRIEAGRPSEIEVVLWNADLNRLTFIEAKLKAGPGACKAVSSTPGRRKRDADCRMFRTSKGAADNGCSYWGIGTGGAAFAGRFSDDLVRSHLRFTPPTVGAEEGAECARLYQLMRNALVGRELADALTESGRPVEFHFLAVLANGHYSATPYLEFARSIKDPAKVRFGVVTWQGIREAVRRAGTQPEVVEYLARHSCVV